MKWLFISLLLVLGCGPQDNSTWEQRNSWSQEWMKKNHIEGTVTCYINSHTCDVVTNDSRTPFYIICAEVSNSVGQKVGVCSLPHGLLFIN